jgi:hypothetical protein
MALKWLAFLLVKQPEPLLVVVNILEIEGILVESVKIHAEVKTVLYLL